MANFKAICTIIWEFESDDRFQECLARVKKQVEDIITYPQGPNFEDFGIQVDLVRMKDRKKLIHIAEFPIHEVFPYITQEDVKREYIVNGKSYSIKMNSDRYFVFSNSPYCKACGLLGNKLMLDINPGDQSPHFNLYAEENGRLVLMTKDHIIPKSKGGPDHIQNYATMCSICNNLKGNDSLDYEQIVVLRKLLSNPEMLPKVELRALIEKTRQGMINNRKETP